MELSDLAAAPQARRIFLTALALGLGNSPEHADSVVDTFLSAVGDPTPTQRGMTFGTLGLRDTSLTNEVAGKWARTFLKHAASLPGRMVSFTHAESIGRFLFLIGYSETLGPTPGDETMDWYRQLVEQLDQVWNGDAPAFVQHVSAACHPPAT